jgi:tRNA modification GTPase
VEAIGIDRALKKIDEADLVLVVFDNSSELNDEDFKLIGLVSNIKNKMFVINKSDLKSQLDRKKLGTDAADIIQISAKEMTGIDQLKKKMISIMMAGQCVESEGICVTNVRHKKCLVEACKHITKAHTVAEAKESPEFVALELKAAMDKIGEIIGETTTEDVLNEIFASFCIGK